MKKDNHSEENTNKPNNMANLLDKGLRAISTIRCVAWLASFVREHGSEALGHLHDAVAWLGENASHLL